MARFTNASLKAVVGALVAVGLASVSLAQEQIPPGFVGGPATVDLGSDVAQIELDSGYIYADAEKTQQILEAGGNITSGNEVGFVAPVTDERSWFLIFEWADEGYVKDDEKDQIDKDAILDRYKRGTEEGNKHRAERGIPPIHVVGWFEEPHYDEASHNLVWALLARDDEGEETVNYNVRLLGREGYMSVTLVDGPEGMARSKPEVERLLGQFNFKPGKTYAEYVQGDKLAEYGLTALVAGGAGLAAAKLGLFAALGKILAKGWKLIVVVVLGIGAGIKRLFGGGKAE